MYTTTNLFIYSLFLFRFILYFFLDLFFISFIYCSELKVTGYFSSIYLFSFSFEFLS
ncbi:unnamed protein product, partial [Rotaria magnacalcarata]